MKKVLVLLCTLLLVVLPVFAQDEEIELPETYESEDGALTFDHPTGWSVELFSDIDGFYVAGNDADFVTALAEGSAESTFASGQLVILFLLPPANLLLGVEADMEPAEAMAILTESMVGVGEEPLEINSALINEVEVPRAYIAVQDESADYLLYLLRHEEQVIPVMVATAAGEALEQEALALAILETIEFGELAQSGNYTNAESGLSFDYAEGWVAIEFMEGIVSIGNSDEALFATEMEVGMSNAGVFLPSALAELYGADMETEPSVILETIGMFFTDGGELGELEALTLGEQAVYRANFTGESREGALFLIETEGGLVLVNGNAASGEFANFEAAVLTIVETLRYTPPAE